MARQRMPAANKKGKSESKAALKRREEIERQLIGSSDDISNIPEYLSPEEKIYYQWLVNETSIQNLIGNVDKPILEQTANCLHIMRVADDNIRANGILVQKTDKYGNIEEKENPAIKINLAYQQKYGQLCNMLGLSPAARAALAGAKIEAKEESSDPLLKVLRGEAI